MHPHGRGGHVATTKPWDQSQKGDVVNDHLKQQPNLKQQSKGNFIIRDFQDRRLWRFWDGSFRDGYMKRLSLDTLSHDKAGWVGSSW